MKLLLARHAEPDYERDSVTEKGRRKGTAYFRMLEFGDISRLCANGEPPSFMARFRERYTNDQERTD